MIVGGEERVHLANEPVYMKKKGDRRLSAKKSPKEETVRIEVLVERDLMRGNGEKKKENLLLFRP